MPLPGKLALAALILLCPLAVVAANEPPLRALIDAHVAKAWDEQGITPAEPASDAEFLRRVSLDLVGEIPTYDETVAFLDDTDPEKRAKWVDRLLDDPRFARHQAETWDMVLFGRNPPGHQTDKREGFQAWLRRQFAENVPYDQWAAAVLRAEGNTVDDGPPMYLVQYKDRPEDAIEAMTEVFLGVQLQCARCHDHPYEDYSQLDFHGMAAFLARLEVVEIGKKNDRAQWVIGEKNAGELLFAGPAAEQSAGTKGEAVPPKFLGAAALDEPPPPEDLDEPRRFPSGKVPPPPAFSRKDALAAWIASQDNPWFAPAVANRVWAQFLGRGLVHPVGDVNSFNPPSHPELYELLAERLVADGYNLKAFIRELVNTQTYQRSSRGSVEDALPRYYEQARSRPLSAEELFRSWRIAAGYDQAATAAGKPPAEDNAFEGVTGGYALSFFGEVTDGTGTFQGGLREHLYLNNGELPRLIRTDAGSLHHTLLDSQAPWSERVDRLFLTILNRPPDDEERAEFVAYLSAEDAPRDRLTEAIWVLMTSSEFRFNH